MSKNINEIPGAIYFGRDSPIKLVLLPYIAGTYNIKLIGTAKGEYTIMTTTLKRGQGTYQKETGTTEVGKIHEYKMDVTKSGTITLETVVPWYLSPTTFVLGTIVLVLVAITVFARQRKKKKQKTPRKYCWSCGKRLDAKANYCVHCRAEQ